MFQAFFAMAFDFVFIALCFIVAGILQALWHNRGMVWRMIDSIAFPCIMLALTGLVQIPAAFFFVGSGVSTIGQAEAQSFAGCVLLFCALIPLTERHRAGHYDGYSPLSPR